MGESSLRIIRLLGLGLALIVVGLPGLAVVQADHTPRIVMPYGQDESHIPIVAGYEVAPRPLGCDVGTILATRTLFSEDFEGDAPQVRFAKDLAQVHNPNAYQNPFHVTRHIEDEKGTDEGHSGDGRLYFGDSATGRMDRGGWRLGGTASFPRFTVPTEPTFFSWADKFEVEGLFGYDHMWIELVDHTNGQVYILCSTDTDVRPDKSSNDGAWSTCSPHRTMLCPTGMRGTGGLDCPTATITPVGLCLPVRVDFQRLHMERLDPDAPHWERRYVQVPDVFAGREVTLRFSADTADGVANRYLGWMADDVAIATGIPLPQPYVHAPTPDVPPDV